MTQTVATFILEQHVGHRTYAANLSSCRPDNDDLALHWVPVEYLAASIPARRLPMPGSVRVALAGRHEVRAGLRAHPADVIVYNTQVPAALGGRLARARPYVVITDVTPVQYDGLADGYGHRPDAFRPLRYMKHRVNSRVFRNAQSCVGWSSWAANSMIEDYGVEPDRVSVIPPGVDTTMWCPAGDTPRDRFRILFVGAEFERKGGGLLLQAFERLPSHAELYLVTKSSVPRRDRVVVIDDLAPNDPRLIELYRSSDVFVLPSLAETFGIAAVEATATGLPVVATAIGGLPDIVVDGETGFTIRPGDVDGLTEALLRLDRDSDLRVLLGRRARARAVTHFDARTNANRLFELALAAARE
jgi:glycosyltransferase involved in cell wall biosynthesis